MAPAYDPVELRRRIVVCFSVSELQKLAQDLGIVGSIAWERGIHEAARDVVRRAETYAGLEALVGKLREVRPLVEWPEPAPEAAPPAPAPEAVVAEPPPAPIAPPAPTGTQPGEPPVFADPYAAPPGSRPAPAFPGTVSVPAAPASRGLDPRILVVVAGLTVAAAVIAFVAGRASSAPVAEGPAPAGSVARRATGPATLAADAMSRSLANVARVCELPGGPSGASVLARVYERCGPPRELPRSPAILPQVPPRELTDAPDPQDQPKAKKPRDQADKAPRDSAPAGGKGCMSSCDAEHRGCKDRCGAEPTESSQYDAFQRCLSRCLATASHCRLSCH